MFSGGITAVMLGLESRILYILNRRASWGNCIIKGSTVGNNKQHVSSNL
ncbi:hypothetical protein CIHG_02630 [Coccidioides immitis H538.4]|uniref:Uncharacterized protein n=1 Tax=Coccidioides immitis H538.4 TaxID=396776 RepID=A0A0J8RJK7_COCIT|nr:hypothetical protein CIHG_02630 [Coccidioides immitis H538.4]